MASASASLISLFLLLLFTRFLPSCFISKAAAAKYSAHYCGNATFFTPGENTSSTPPNSIYKANIDTLLSHLSSNASSSKNGFYNTTTGEDPNMAYGTFLCRGDVSADLCQVCVANASKDIAQRCGMEKMGIIWYDECTIRYSDQNIFSIIREIPSTDLNSLESIDDKDRFNQLLASVMKTLVERASGDDQSGKKFANGEANFTSRETLYSLVQCTPDLTNSLCFRCLQSAVSNIPVCCDGKKGASLLLPSCNIRYEMFPFYRLNGTNTLVFPSPPSTTSGIGPSRQSKNSTPVIIAVVAPIATALVLLALGLFLLRRRASKKYNALPEENVMEDTSNVSESLQFNLATIKAAVNNFSSENKIGQGGFGEVYRGTLSNGQEVAVKRLSKNSIQGAEEFRNEVSLLHKLQHRNLVRLLGFCLNGEEKLLIYEYMPNKSLDYFLFDPEKQGYLDWPKRYKIIGGIARGLLYLHEDSRLKIIHRDLKASNILLGENMNARISDFGMARIFGGDQTQANTNRVVGTFGYMSPEYAMHGQFSMKSDVFSFGVLILEIISGKRNSSFHESDGAEDLLSYAWMHWKNGTPLEMMDSNLMESYSRNQVIRCIHVGLLCVQEDPANRPMMTTVVLTLDSHSVSLAVPQKPSLYFTGSRASPRAKGLESSDPSSITSMPLSANEVSITEIGPR